VMNSQKYARLIEQEALDGSAAYTPAEFVRDVRKGVWTELGSPQVKINTYRRNLQQVYLSAVNSKLNGPAPTLPAGLPPEFASLFAGIAPSEDEKAMYRAELRDLNSAVTADISKAADRATKAHLEAVKDQIARILDPKFAAGGGAGGGVGAIRVLTEEELRAMLPPDGCWPDYVIRP